MPTFSHSFVVVMENLSEQSALATPSIAAPAQRIALATSWYGVSHPSLLNDLALISGSTFGISWLTSVVAAVTSSAALGPPFLGQAGSAGIRQLSGFWPG